MMGFSHPSKGPRCRETVFQIRILLSHSLYRAKHPSVERRAGYFASEPNLDALCPEVDSDFTASSVLTSE